SDHGGGHTVTLPAPGDPGQSRRAWGFKSGERFYRSEQPHSTWFGRGWRSRRRLAKARLREGAQFAAEEIGGRARSARTAGRMVAPGDLAHRNHRCFHGQSTFREGGRSCVDPLEAP